MPKTTSKRAVKRTQPKRTVAQTKPIKKTSLEPENFPGYFRFTRQVAEMLWSNRQTFFRLALILWGALFLIIGLTAQAQYASLSEATHEAVSIMQAGAGQALVATWVLFSSVLTGTLLSGLSEGQQIFQFAVYGTLWLVAVWLLRHLLAGTEVKVRDGLYNAGAPVIPALTIIGIGILQLLPLALVVSLFAALQNTGALNGALVASLMGIVALGLGVATLYWMSSTFFAFIITTIPGTYPLAAFRSARTVIAGRRGMVLARLAWLLLALLIAFTVVMLPLSYLDGAFKFGNSFLFVAIYQLVSVVVAIYATAYVYLLYRKVIDGRTE